MTDTPNERESDGRRPDWFGAAETDDRSTDEKEVLSPEGAGWFDDVEPKDVDIAMSAGDSASSEHDLGVSIDTAGPNVSTDTADDPRTDTDAVDATGETSDGSFEESGGANSTEVGETESTATPTSTDENTNQDRSADLTTHRASLGDSGAATSDGAEADESVTDGASADTRSWPIRFLAWVRSILRPR